MTSDFRQTSGSSSRRKGARGELEAAKLLGATKVSRAWQPGPDLVFMDRAVEVKLRKDGFKSLYGWLEDSQLLQVKADRRDFLTVLRTTEFLDILEEEYRRGFEDGAA